MARARPKQAAVITGGQTADVRHRGNQGTKHKSMCVGEPNCSIDLHLAGLHNYYSRGQAKPTNKNGNSLMAEKVTGKHADMLNKC
jgi:hypothetical protein